MTSSSKTYPLTIGVLGGMGPAATVDFMNRVLRATNAASDQDHLRMIVDNNPRIPDRSAAIRGTGPSPGPALAKMAQGLVQAGADFLVMPCNTAHSFRDDVKAAVQVPFIDMIEETVANLRALNPSVRSVGLLASAGCIQRGLYDEALANSGIKLISASGAVLDELMALIYRIKAGHETARERQEMAALGRKLIDQGAESLISGCTEIPLVLDQEDVPVPLLSSTGILAERAVAYAKGEVGLRGAIAA